MRRTWLRLIWMPCSWAAAVSAFKVKSSGVLLVGFVLWPQAPIRLQHEPSGGEQGYQGDERAAFLFSDAPLAARAGPIAQAVDPLGIKGEQPFADGLLVAGKFSRDGPGAQALPAQDNHLGSSNPVGRGMTAASQLTDLALLDGILGWASYE
jgi:hypothetical protein